MEFYNERTYNEKDKLLRDNDFLGLKNIVDDSTTVVYVPTPKGWKCKRKNCQSNIKHKHTNLFPI